MAKRLTKTPLWASAQVESICQRAQVPSPRLHWYRSLSDIGAYTPLPSAISVQETYEDGHRLAAEITLLHELAHHLAHQVAQAYGHCAAFWEICWRLYLDQGIPLDQAVYGEFSYHAGAEPALRALALKLDPLTEAAGAYGAACRRIDALEVKIRRLQRAHASTPAPSLMSPDLNALQERQALLLATASVHLQAWQANAPKASPNTPLGAIRACQGLLSAPAVS